MPNKTIDLDEYMLSGEPMPDIRAIGGERWFPLNTTIEEDMTTFWGGDWGCSSEISRLRAVLLHRPGDEIRRFVFARLLIPKSLSRSMTCWLTTIVLRASRYTMLRMDAMTDPIPSSAVISCS